MSSTSAALFKTWFASRYLNLKQLKSLTSNFNSTRYDLILMIWETMCMKRMSPSAGDHSLADHLLCSVGHGVSWLFDGKQMWPLLLWDHTSPCVFILVHTGFWILDSCMGPGILFATPVQPGGILLGTSAMCCCLCAWSGGNTWAKPKFGC